MGSLYSTSSTRSWRLSPGWRCTQHSGRLDQLNPDAASHLNPDPAGWFNPDPEYNQPPSYLQHRGLVAPQQVIQVEGTEPLGAWFGLATAIATSAPAAASASASTPAAAAPFATSLGISRLGGESDDHPPTPVGRGLARELHYSIRLIDPPGGVYGVWGMRGVEGGCRHGNGGWGYCRPESEARSVALYPHGQGGLVLYTVPLHRPPSPT